MNDIYSNDYSAEHSDSLREHFDISSIGVDTYTDNNISVEFKESFSNNPKRNFKISKNQIKTTDLIVFCHFTSQFFVHTTKHLKSKYSCNNKLNLYVINHKSIEKNYLYKTDNYIDLKNFLNNYEKI